MSEGVRIPLADALDIARNISEQLEDVCVRSKVVGSVRRKRPTVSDIEFVVEPMKYNASLFGEEQYDIDSVRMVARELGDVVKNGDRYIQIEHVMAVSGLKLDLFLVHPPAQWGSILAIRTGPAELGRFAVTRLPEFGLYHRDGHIEDKDGKLHPTPTEEDFFAAARLPCLPPSRRDSREAMLPLSASPEARELFRQACK